MKQFLITVFLLLVLVEAASSHYRWNRWLRRPKCSKQSILDHLCPEVEDCPIDPCTDVDCNRNGDCVDGICECDPGFNGNNCEFEDICTLEEDVCRNGAVCEDNACSCVGQFEGDRCERCSNYSVGNIGFLRNDFFLSDPIANPTSSCESICNSMDNCTGFLILGDGCNTFKAPVLDALDLQPNPTIAECEERCAGIEECLSLVFRTTEGCFLFSVSDRAEIENFDSNSGSFRSKMCDV